MTRRLAKWSHGHSIGTGVLGGLLLAGHTLELVTLAFIAGAFSARLRRAAGRMAQHMAATLNARESRSRARRRGGFDWADIEDAKWRRTAADTYPNRSRIAGVLDRVGRMLRDDEPIPF